MSEYILIPIAFVTSTLTAIVGLGGGMLLIAVMPGFVPAAALIPVHGVVQLASNASRALFSFADVVRPIALAFTLGAIIGSFAGAPLLAVIDWEFLPVVLAVFILLVTWAPRIEVKFPVPGKFVTLGAVQTLLSLFLGAPGPLTTPFLMREGLTRDQIVATHGSLMTVMHSAKILAFGAIGFAFSSYFVLMLGMTIAGILGSYVGTRIRSKVPEERFRTLLKILLTLLSFRILYAYFILSP